MINGLNQGNSQLIFLVPKTDCTYMREQMIWTAVLRQEMRFLEWKITLLSWARVGGFCWWNADCFQVIHPQFQTIDPKNAKL